jgi:hypothetical protein
MSLQLDKLRMSLRQKFVSNTDAAMANWPQIFFWTDGLILLNWTEGLLKRISELNHPVQDKFWQGSVSPQIRELDPDLFAKWPLVRIVEYCQIWKSKKRAWTRLIMKARGEREQRKRDSEITFGEIRLDEQHWMLREAALHKAVNIYAFPHVIHKAAEQNDVRFFIRLGRVLQSTKRPVEIDWKRVDPIAGFLVNNWCEGQDYKSRLLGNSVLFGLSGYPSN